MSCMYLSFPQDPINLLCVHTMYVIIQVLDFKVLICQPSEQNISKMHLKDQLLCSVGLSFL